MIAMAAVHSLTQPRSHLLPCIVYLLASCLVVACYTTIQRTDHSSDNSQLDTALGILAMQHGQRRLHAEIPPACSLKAEVGLCRASLTRYHYDATTETCKEFNYGGCGGNDNNFNTQEECMATCATGQQSSGSPPQPGTDPEQGGAPPATTTNPTVPSNPQPIATPTEQAPAPAPAPSSGQQTCPELFTYTALFACVAMLLRLL